MGSLERKLLRNKLKKMKGDNNISGAWHKYQELKKNDKKKEGKK